MVSEFNVNDRIELGKLLAELYRAQMSILFQGLVMEIFMEQLKISEEQAIKMLNEMIKQEWLVTNGFKPKFFLRKGYVSCFPVVVSKKGLDYLREKGLKD